MEEQESNKQKLDLNSWNDRLDQNLEGTEHGNLQADENAEQFNNQFGSDHLRKAGIEGEVEDNMKINQPKPGQPNDGEIEREE